MTEQNIDFRAAGKQAFGQGYETRDDDVAKSAAIMAGRITIDSHPLWEVPGSIAWNEDPFGDEDWVHKFQSLQWLEPLRRVAEAGNHGAKNFWISTVRSWMQAKSLTKDLPDAAWSHSVCGVRSLSLVLGLSLVSIDDGDWLKELIQEHGERLAADSDSQPSIGTLQQYEGLLVVGLALRERAWVSLAQRRLDEMLRASFDSEGMLAGGGSIGQHRMQVSAWETILRRLEAAQLECPGAARRLRSALLGLAYATKPDGHLEQIGDTKCEGVTDLSSGEIDYVKSEGADGHPPADLTKVYDAGFVFGRSGWGDYERSFKDELFFSLSFGSATRLYGHQDGASLTLHSNGQPWLIDTASHEEASARMRSYCASRMGHNVVTIEGREYDPSSFVSLIRKSISPEVEDFEFRDVGYEGVAITRRVIYCRGGDFFVVVDTVTSSDEVTAHQRWHLDSEVKATRSKSGFVLSRSGRLATILWRGNAPKLSVVSGQDDPFDGWVASDTSPQQPASVLVAERTGQRFRFVTIVGSGRLDITGVDSAAGRITVKVIAGRSRYDVSYGRDQVASVSLHPVGEGEASTAPVPINLERCLSQLMPSTDFIAVMPKMGAEFSQDYWAQLRTWVRAQPDILEARKAALAALLEYLMIVLPSDRNDQGLRAAIVDLAGNDLGPDLGVSGQNLGIMREPLITWPGAAVTSSQTYKTTICSALTPSEVSIPKTGTAIYTAETGGLTLPILVGKGDGGNDDILSVRFHGAINRTRAVHPMFQGLTDEKSRGHNFAIFSDPTLDLDRTMSLAWYLGTGKNNLFEYMAECIQHLAEQVGSRKVVLAGSSGGGFTALQVGSYLPSSSVLALNPQTAIPSYFNAAVERALKASRKLGHKSRYVSQDVDENLSVITRYRRLQETPKIVYVQNMQDEHHVKKHYLQFKAMIENHSSSQQIKFLEVQDGKGHVAVPKEKYAGYWNLAADL